MSSVNKHISADQVAKSTPYDNTNSGLTSTDVQGAIDELFFEGGKNVSPGFGFGRSGNVGSGTYLLAQTVPSNVASYTIHTTNTYIESISIGNENIATFDVTIEEHDGVTHTPLYTASVISSRTAYFNTNISVTTGKMLAVYVSSGSAKNLVVELQLKGQL